MALRTGRTQTTHGGRASKRSSGARSRSQHEPAQAMTFADRTAHELALWQAYKAGEPRPVRAEA